jgi:hypothetical protein
MTASVPAARQRIGDKKSGLPRATIRDQTCRLREVIQRTASASQGVYSIRFFKAPWSNGAMTVDQIRASDVFASPVAIVPQRACAPACSPQIEFEAVRAALTRDAVRSLLHAKQVNGTTRTAEEDDMIRKLPSGEYRLYSRKKDPKTGRRRNLGTFATREGAEKHERAVQYFKHH